MTDDDYSDSIEYFTCEISASGSHGAIEDKSPINKWINHQNLLLLFSKMDAVIGKDYEDGFVFLKYWKRLKFQKQYSQVMSIKPIAYFSGFCSRHRGLHWRT